MAVMVRPVCGFLRGLGSCLGWCDWRGIWQTAHLLRTMPCFRFGDGPWLAAAGRNVERCAGRVGLNYKNHILFGVACWIGVAACLGEAPRPASICAAGFAALLPDVDHSSSMLGRWVPVLPRIMPHRGLTHSAAALVGMAAVLWLAFVHFPQWPQLWLAAFVGYASGIAGDVLTRNGVQFLWPFKPRLRLFLPPPRQPRPTLFSAPRRSTPCPTPPPTPAPPMVEARSMTRSSTPSATPRS